MTQQQLPRRRRTPRRVYWQRRALVLLLGIGLLAGLGSAGRAFWQAASSRFAEPATNSSSTAAAPTSSATAATKQRVGACNDADIRVEVRTTKGSEFAPGSVIGLRAEITNAGEVECLRDIGASANEVFVTDADGTPIWSSNACPANSANDLVRMRPGDVYRISVKWPTTKDAAICGDAGAPVGTGNYAAYARNGAVQSGQPAAITLK